MGLYEAEFLGQAKPVKKRAPKQKETEPVAGPSAEVAPVKKVRKRKPKADPIDAAVDAAMPTPPASLDVKVKKPRKTKEAKAAEKTGELKEAVATKKVTLAPKKAKEVEQVSESAPPAKKQKRAKKIVIENGTQTSDEPPLWFKTWHLDQAKRENAQKAKAERAPAPAVKEAAHAVANNQWSDGYTRDKIRVEQDNHQTRLYKMIHGRTGF